MSSALLYRDNGMYIDAADNYRGFDSATFERWTRAKEEYTLLVEPAVIAFVARSLPRRWFVTRGARVTPIRSYPLALSESAADEYEKARNSGFFDVFQVVTPTYGRSAPPYDSSAQRGSWIVGRVNSTSWWAMIAEVDVF